MKEFKKCSICGQEKSVDAFQPATSQCKICYKQKRAEYSKNRYHKLKTDTTTRRCVKCNKELTTDKFTGRSDWCNMCYDRFQKQMKRPE